MNKEIQNKSTTQNVIRDANAGNKMRRLIAERRDTQTEEEDEDDNDGSSESIKDEEIGNRRRNLFGGPMLSPQSIKPADHITYRSYRQGTQMVTARTNVDFEFNQPEGSYAVQ